MVISASQRRIKKIQEKEATQEKIEKASIVIFMMKGKLFLSLCFLCAITVVPTTKLQALSLTSRTVYLSGPVTGKSINDIVQKVLLLNMKSHRPIYLMINSPGGAVAPGMILVDTIKAIKSPVYAVIVSEAYSMGAIIATFCQKIYIFPHATMMFHNVTYSTRGEEPAIQSYVRFSTKQISQIHREIASKMKISYSEYRRRIRDGWWLLAKEASKLFTIPTIIVHKLSLRP